MGRLRRREFLQGSLALASLGLLSGCTILPPQWQAPRRVRRIGVLLGGSPGPSPLVDAFRQGLRELGYVEGEGTVIEFRYAEGREERFPELAAELVRLPVDVIVATGGPPALAAQRVTDTIPIVMPTSGDPVGQGLVASLARPGGNVTGLAGLAQELSGKRLELLKEIVPGAARVAVLWNAANPAKALEFKQTQAAAATLGLKLQSLEIRGADDFEAVSQAAGSDRADGLVVFGDSFFLQHRRRIVDFAAQRRLPAIYELKEFVEAGGLMSYGPSLPDLFRRAAGYVDKILKGARPAELPVERAERFDFIINLKTAQSRGLTIPQSVLIQVTEIIQ